MNEYQKMLINLWGGYENLTLYELTFKANNELISGNEITLKDKEYIVNRFLDGISGEETIVSFRNGVRAPKNEMHPLFYIPPSYDEGKKSITISTIMPKTQLFSVNSYELEILRLLAVMSKDNPQVSEMLDKTKKRLSAACVEQFCGKSEYLEISIVALRFLTAACPNETERMKKYINAIKNHISDKKRHSGVNFYYWLTLSELPIELAQPEIERYKEFLVNLLPKSFVMNSEHDKYASPFGKYILRNCLCRLDEYTYLKDRVPYISEKNGRILFDIQ